MLGSCRQRHHYDELCLFIAFSATDTASRKSLYADQVNENQDARFLCSRAEIIDELEESVPSWLQRKNSWTDTSTF